MHSLIDLVFISDYSYLSFCHTIPPFSTSDHFGLMIGMKMKCSSQQILSHKRLVWRYASADWDKARDMTEAFDWDSLVSDDMNLYWSQWCAAFLSIMRECVPGVILPPQKNNANSSIRKDMRKRNRLFQKFGYCAQFRSARNQVTKMLRKAKLEYFKHLNPNDLKQFWKTVKFINKKQSVIPELVLDDKVARSDKKKAEALNAFFTSCFSNFCSPITHVESVLHHCAQQLTVTLKKFYISSQVFRHQKPVVLIRFLQVCF